MRSVVYAAFWPANETINTLAVGDFGKALAAIGQFNKTDAKYATDNDCVSPLMDPVPYFVVPVVAHPSAVQL